MWFDGAVRAGVTARAPDMDGRIPLYNMSIEAKARAGMIASDKVSIVYLADKTRTLEGEVRDVEMKKWRELRNDDAFEYAETTHVAAAKIAPMVACRINSASAMALDGKAPYPQLAPDMVKLLAAFKHMNLEPGPLVDGQRIEVAFLGLRMNSRRSDLRSAVQFLKSRPVAAGIRMLVLPGFAKVRAEAEAAGLDPIFRDTDSKRRAPGCSMYLGMNDDRLESGMYAVNTSAHDFAGRQDPGGKTFLVSPAPVAAGAIGGKTVGVCQCMGGNHEI